jgi:hypothetical protein
MQQHVQGIHAALCKPSSTVRNGWKADGAANVHNGSVAAAAELKGAVSLT